jgi:hypothetical protein
LIPNARRQLVRRLAGLGAFALVAPLAACSSEPISRFTASPFATPSELLLWGPDDALAGRLAGRVWSILDALDGQWQRAPAPMQARLLATLRASGAGLPALDAPTAGVDADIAWRGLALDSVAGELRAPDLNGALLTLGQHLLALGERGFRPWHVGIPDPANGRTLLGLDLYAEERLVTVADYAQYRNAPWLAPNQPTALASPDPGAGECASCSVVVRGGQAARAALIAVKLHGASRQDWPERAAAVGADGVLWIGRDARVEATTVMAKRVLMADQRRQVRERTGS